jgi:hypothetical protein
MIYHINTKKKIKESRHLKEAARSVESVAAWLKDSIAAMTANQELTISRRILDNNFGFYVYWTQGFDANDDSVIHADADKTYGLVAALKCRNDAEWDGDYMDCPYDTETGDLYCEDYELSPKDNTVMVAEWLIEDYESMLDIMDKNPDITIGGLKEAKSITEDRLDDYGVSKTRADIIVKQASNSKFYIDKNRYILGKDLLDYFDTNEIVEYSPYETSDSIRVPNSYTIVGRSVDESKSIKEDKYSRDLAKRLKSLTNGDEDKKSSNKNKGKKIATWKVVQTSGARLTVADDFLSEYEAAKYVEEHGGTGKLKVVKNDSVNESKSIKEAPDADGILYDYEVGAKYNDIANAEMKQNAEYRKRIGELRVEISKLVPEVQEIINTLRESGETFYKMDIHYNGFGLRHSRAGAQICIDSKYGSNKLPKGSTYLTISQDDGSQNRIACSTTVTESGEILSDWDKGSWTNFSMRDPGYARVKALETFLDYFDAVKEKFYSEFNKTAESKSIKESAEVKTIKSTIDGSELKIIEKNCIPDTNSFKAIYTTGDNTGVTCTFVEADNNGIKYLKSLGFKAEELNGDEFIDLPTECLEGPGITEGSYYITKNNFEEYKDLKEANNTQSKGVIPYKNCFIVRDIAGDGWNVFNADREIEEEGCATVDDAKTVIDNLTESKSTKLDEGLSAKEILAQAKKALEK